MELLDYLAWRNDVPLSIAPFNEVDMLSLPIWPILILLRYGRNGMASMI